ncbi:MAG: hypothetical protein KJO04_03500 [Bacteroidia bacterium]|nr:hypothetical protein [Bacteroidia bacterium]
MALQIKNKQGFIEVFGSLHGPNMNVLRTYLESEFRWNDYLTLSLEKLRDLDRTTAQELEQFYLKAVKKNQVLSIIGRNHTPVSSVMENSKTDYILSYDRA